MSHTNSFITSVRIPTGHSMTNVVALLSSDGNNSNQTLGAMKNNQNITTDISRMSGDIKINSTKLNEMLAIFNTSQNQN